MAAAIEFAQKFNLRSRPKAGGHSYVGASVVADGLVIDVSRINRVGYRASDKTALVGAGAELYRVHKRLAAASRTIPTGTCPTVGAAGLTLGGGLGVASRQYGLTCDQLAGLTMVTADGQIRHVDADENRPLFWASRGGGGGNFGIVTAMRFHTQPAAPMGIFLLTFPWSKAPAVIRGWARRIQKMRPSTVGQPAPRGQRQRLQGHPDRRSVQGRAPGRRGSRHGEPRPGSSIQHLDLPALVHGRCRVPGRRHHLAASGVRGGQRDPAPDDTRISPGCCHGWWRREPTADTRPTSSWTR